MDLLATFFFCAVACQSVKQHNATHPILLMLKSSALAASLLCAVYIGFMIIAHRHAVSLQGLGAEQIIPAISTLLLGKFGGIFVCITVSFACIATGLAITAVCTDYLTVQICHNRISKHTALALVMILSYGTSCLDFRGIMQICSPIVQILYPPLIVLCIMNILHQWKGITYVRIPVLLSGLAYPILHLYAG
jgi:LIVCS family branched-chain amino acid:cation transporter